MKLKSPLLLAYLALALVCIIWGTTYLALRVAVTNFPPFLFSAIRQVIAGSILLFIVIYFMKEKWPSKKVWMAQAFAGMLMITFGNGFVAWGELYVNSGLASIICSSMPIWVLLINLFLSPNEKPTWKTLLGVGLGLLGIVIIFGQDITGFSTKGYVLGILAIIFANISWAYASIWVKKHHQKSSPFVNAAIQMLCGGILLAVFSPLVDDYNTIHWNNTFFNSMLYLIFIGSLVAYSCYAYAIKHLPMTLVSMYAYINPIVAVFLGWLVLTEPITIKTLFSMLIILIGIYLVNTDQQKKLQAKITADKE
jgi:drug/metabolite transporter (DMT)-like permease